MKVANNIKYFDTLTPFKVCHINKQKFAIFLNEITVQGDLTLDVQDLHIILLAQVTTRDSIHILSRSFTAFSNVQAENGTVCISTTSNISLIGAEVLSKYKPTLHSPEPIHKVVGLPDREQFIKELFQCGLSDKDNECMIDAISATYDAIVDPALDSIEEYSIEEAFDFFNIPKS